MEISKNKIGYIKYTRVAAMMFVILVHICQQSSSRIIVSLAQFFIVGVMIFIMLTGYLYGMQSRNKQLSNMRRWIDSKLIKFIPIYYLVVILVVTLNAIIYNKNYFDRLWMLFLCCQDFCGEYFHEITGLGHLWYITLLVLEYAVIAILWKTKKNKQNDLLIVLIGAVLSIIVTMFVQVKVGRYILYLTTAAATFIYGNAGKRVFDSKKNYIVLTFTNFLIWIIRVYLVLTDFDSDFYTNVFTYFTHIIMAVWIIATFSLLIKSEKTPKVIDVLDDISYEVFLCHYMFVVGPIRVIGITNVFLIDSLLVIFLSMASGLILAQCNIRISYFLKNLLFKKA